jgi:hypothetical protein
MRVELRTRGSRLVFARSAHLFVGSVEVLGIVCGLSLDFIGFDSTNVHTPMPQIARNTFSQGPRVFVIVRYDETSREGGMGY